MTLINPNPVASIRFECEICNRGLRSHSTISDGCSGEPDDWEGKPISELYCPVHWVSYKRECYNCKREYGCEMKVDRPKRKGVGVKITWFGDPPNDEKTIPPCKSWKERGKFYTEPTCWYCRYKEDANEDLENGCIRMHGYFCSSESSSCYGRLIKYNAPACKSWKSKYTLKDKIKHHRGKIDRWWKEVKKKISRPFREFSNRLKRVLIRDEEGECEWCKYCSTETDECENEKSPFYGYCGYAWDGDECTVWKHVYPAWKRKWIAFKYLLTGKW